LTGVFGPGVNPGNHYLRSGGRGFLSTVKLTSRQARGLLCKKLAGHEDLTCVMYCQGLGCRILNGSTSSLVDLREISDAFNSRTDLVVNGLLQTLHLPK
jgi:hypothetical protein